ncbi:MAG: winged helix-turn-helix domain-containing protein [Candidatus Thermoplasmatota archaeon]|nr:winged helix-turn-helix domain-containing protein [Candidatus Thermoplasmatota archaeon]
MRVTLDKKALLALASDTRLAIMRNLEPMRRTVTQVADALDIDKAGVHRHLRKLVEGDLVRRHDDHGFVYYGLSWKGRDILNPTENTKIVILLGLSAVLLLGAVLVIFAALTPLPGPATADPYFGGFEQDYRFGLTGEAATDTDSGSPGAVIVSLNPVLLFLGLLLLPAAAVLLAGATRRLWRPFQRPAPSADVAA